MTNPAAERLRNVKLTSETVIYIDHPLFIAGSSIAKCIASDRALLAEAYLSEHLPDDGEAIAKIWFRGQTQRLSPLDRALLTKLVDEKRITTRGQLRLLLRALGVEVEGK